MSEAGRPLRGSSTTLAVAVLVAAAAWSLSGAARYRNVSSDLVQDYLSARAIRAGDSVYTPHPEEWAIPPSGTTRAEVVNDHPPPYVVALAPLGLLPYPVAFLVLAAANVAAAVGACFLVARELGWSRRTGAFLAAGILVHPGTATCLAVGNVSLLLLGLLALGWSDFRRGRGARAGVWVGLAAGVKLYPGLMVLGFLANRSWRSAAVAVCVAGGCWLASALVVGPGDLITYARSRAPANAAAYVGHGFNLSVAGAAHRFFGEPNAHSPWLGRAAVAPELAAGLARAGQLLVGLIVVAGVVRARAAADYPDRAFAVLTPGMLLLSPLTWLHAVPMMLIPVAVLARGGVRGASAVALAVCSVAMCANDHWLANRCAELTGTPVPWTANFVLLAPTWGMLGVLVLAASRPPDRPLTPSSPA